ncbi:MAG: prephenate dehydrogenase [Pirellulaceae bacterium]
MSSWNQVAIVGVGLIGGSVGMALRARGLARHVVGVGRSSRRLRRARQRGAVTATSTSLSRGVASADLVVVCTPVHLVVESVRQAAGSCPAGTLITDVGSTKERIVTALDEHLGAAEEDVAFVGSHPMAGSEKSGVQFAEADLLMDRLVIVTPSRRTRPANAAAIEDLWKSLGARVIRTSPAFHDRAAGAVSHLPHAVASALAAGTQERDLPLAATGWRDTTRIAAGDVDLWTRILLENRAHVLKSLGKFEKVLSSLRQALEGNDRAKLEQLLAAGKRNRDAVGN